MVPIPDDVMNPSRYRSKPLDAWKFFCASLLGISLFLMPIPWHGETTVLLSHANALVKKSWSAEVLGYGALCALVTIIFSLAANLGKWNYLLARPRLRRIFLTSRLGLIVRVMGAAAYLLIYFQQGPEWLIGESTGGLVMNGFIGGLYVTFTLGNLILPLLMSFGLLEFMGSLLKPVMRRLFDVPGRSAVDAVASFVGDGTLGIMVTDEQYAQGYYNKREATLIATSFSVVGIAFAAFVADELGFADRFAVFYGTIVFTTLIVALVIARLPLMKRYPKDYYPEAEVCYRENSEPVNLPDAYQHALQRASGSDWRVFQRMLPTIFNIHMTFIPVIILVGTLGLAVAEYSPVFNWLSAPLVPFYQALQIPEAEVVAKASLIGFVDMYLPTLLIKESPSEMARFIVGTLSFTQLIFMAETGSILLRTRMGFRFVEVLGFFLLRTLLSLPVILIVAHLLF